MRASAPSIRRWPRAPRSWARSRSATWRRSAATSATPRPRGVVLLRRAPHRARAGRAAAGVRDSRARPAQRRRVSAPHAAARARHRRSRCRLAGDAHGRRVREGAYRAGRRRADARSGHRGRAGAGRPAADAAGDHARGRPRRRGGPPHQRSARLGGIPASSRPHPDPSHARAGAGARERLTARRSLVAKQILKCTVNGDAVEALVQPYVTLLDALREDLGLTGPKEGCGTGDCGACSIHLDGHLVASCLVLAMQARGRSVTTIEGLARGGTLTPVQDAFVRLGVPQCGFCIPGVLMAAAALLDENPKPTEEEIRYAIAGNLCRCTGYTTMITAISEAAGVAANRGSARG